MDLTPYYVTSIATSLIVLWIWARRLDKSDELRKDFVKLGNFKGKTLDEISTAVKSRPSLFENLGNGHSAHTWVAAKYQIKLQFDEKNICVAKLVETTK